MRQHSRRLLHRLDDSDARRLPNITLRRTTIRNNIETGSREPKHAARNRFARDHRLRTNIDDPCPSLFQCGPPVNLGEVCITYQRLGSEAWC